jgi:hypothetical protein
MVGKDSKMAVKEVEAAEMVTEEEAAGMEDLSVGVVAYPHPSILSLVPQEEDVGSIPMAIGIEEAIGNDPKQIDQQENAGGSHIVFADQPINGGGLAEMEAKSVEVAEMLAEDDAARTEEWTEDLSVGVVDNNIIKWHSCPSPRLFGVSAEVPLDDGCSADSFTENVADADDENVADADDVLKSRAPPAGKLGFKGKRANKKHGHNGKRGSKQKAGRTSLLL